MASVAVYKHGVLLGTGTSVGGNATITSYSGTAPGPSRNDQMVVTSGALAGGSGTSSLTLSVANPYAG